MALLSVLMAVYNAEDFIRQAIDSLIAQSYRNFELIIIDDGSSDQTRAILDSYQDQRIQCFRNSANLGQTRSLIIGMEKCQGAYIARQDADDRSDPLRLEKQIAFLDAHPDIGLVGTAYQIVDRTGAILEEVRPVTSDLEIQKHLIEIGNCFCHGSVMYRRSYYQQAGGYRPFFHLTQDFDLWLRMGEICKLANLDEILYQFRFDTQTVSRKKPDTQLAYRRLAQELALQRRATGKESPLPNDILEEVAPEPIRVFRNTRRAAYLFYVAGQLDEADQTLIQALDLHQNLERDQPDWASWVYGCATEIARLKSDVGAGEDYLNWSSKLIYGGADNPQARQVFGQFFADQAFLAYSEQHKQKTLQYSLKALRHNPQLYRNRGLIKITLSSLW